MVFIPVPQDGLIFSWFIEMAIVLFSTIFSASSIGLLVSVFAKNSSVASLATVLLVVPQLAFSGIMIPLHGFSEKLSNFILSRWSVEAFGTINDFNSLISQVQEVIPGYVRDIESEFEFTVEHLTSDLAIIILMAVILFVSSYYILKHQLESDK